MELGDERFLLHIRVRLFPTLYSAIIQQFQVFFSKILPDSLDKPRVSTMEYIRCMPTPVETGSKVWSFGLSFTGECAIELR